MVGPRRARHPRPVVLALATALLLAWAAPSARPAESPAEVLLEEGEGMVAEAIQRAFMGDTATLEKVAVLRRIEEERAEADGAELDERHRIADNIAALAAAARRPPIEERTARGLLDGFERDVHADGLLLQLERTEPRSRFRRAQAAVRYENRRRVLNSVVGAAAGVLNLQLFSLFQPPLDAAEYLVVGRRYLTPEQRRRFQAARTVLAVDEFHDQALAVAQRDLARRRLLAALQARRNAERAGERGDWLAADWWHRRHALLSGREPDARAAEVAARLDQEARNRRQSNTFAEGADTMAPPAFAAYTDLLRALLTVPGSPRSRALALDYRVRYGAAPGGDAAGIIAAVAERRGGDEDLARRRLRAMANGTGGAWADRLDAYLLRPRFDPATAFEHAFAARAERRRRYLVAGRDPRLANRVLTPEQARAVEAQWITAARSLFVFDIVGRAILMPFTPGRFFPADEVFDAAGRTPAWYAATDEGRADSARVARLYRQHGRYMDAARAYAMAGDAGREAQMLHRAAGQLVEELEETADPGEAEVLARRFLNAWPGDPRREEVERLRDEARARRGLADVVIPDELRARPGLAGEGGLGLDPALFDGRRRNGEITGDGVMVFDDGRLAFRTRRGGPIQESWIEPATVTEVRRQLRALRREQGLRQALEQPREIKRIPIEISGGMFPGFSAAPGLVPLEVDPRNRVLYE